MSTFYKHFSPVLFLVTCCLVGCGNNPTNVDNDSFQPAYVTSFKGDNWRLYTQIPVPQSALGPDMSVFTGQEYNPQEIPPGESFGKWTRQNLWYCPQKWTSNEEFWYGWMLLDLLSVDRSNNTSPLLLQSYGVGGLFDAFKNDLFTAYYPPERAKALNDALSGTEIDSVFGLFFRAWPRDTLVAAQVVNGSAAWSAGLRVDDRLLEFDGRWAATSMEYLRDTAGHRPVEFRYRRPTTGAIAAVTVSRSPREMPSLFVDTLPGAVGYIFMSQFVATPGLATDTFFQDAAEWLDMHSKGAWILDLRGNGGGAIETARNILSALLPIKTNLLRLRQREFDPKTLGGVEFLDTLRTNDNVTRRLANRPIYLLQDSISASASEIVISSLRENLGASIRTLGDTSYGKGIGQLYIETPLGGYMAITCLHIDPLRAPSYHGLGIAPDAYFASGDSAIDQAWNLARATITSPSLAKKMITPNFAALEWNRREMKHSNIPLLQSPGPCRPFQVR